MKWSVLQGALACAAALGLAGAPTVVQAQSVDVAKMLNGIERGCNYDGDAAQRVYAAYDATADTNAAGRWVATVRKPDGGRALSPALGRGTMTIDNADQVSRLVVRVQGTTWNGLPVSGLEWIQGLEHGVSIFRVHFAMPMAVAKTQLRAKGVTLRATEDAETGMVFEPILSEKEGDALASVIACDFSM